MARKIAIVNRKGGCGKTTTSTSLFYILKQKGYRCLIIDCDNQANATDTMRAGSEGVATLYDVILEEDGGRISIPDAVQHTEFGDILAGDELLNEGDQVLKGANVTMGTFRLKKAVEEVDGDYDFIIFDTNPSINAILESVLIAADECIIPVEAERYSVQGLDAVIRAIQAVKETVNPKLRIDGFLLTKYNKRTVLASQIRAGMENYAKVVGTRVFDAAIRPTNNVGKAQGMQMPLTEFAPNCTAAKDYRDFTEEVLKEGE